MATHQLFFFALAISHYLGSALLVRKENLSWVVETFVWTSSKSLAAVNHQDVSGRHLPFLLLGTQVPSTRYLIILYLNEKDLLLTFESFTYLFNVLVPLLFTHMLYIRCRTVTNSVSVWQYLLVIYLSYTSVVTIYVYYFIILLRICLNEQYIIININILF